MCNKCKEHYGNYLKWIEARSNYLMENGLITEPVVPMFSNWEDLRADDTHIRVQCTDLHPPRPVLERSKVTLTHNGAEVVIVDSSRSKVVGQKYSDIWVGCKSEERVFEKPSEDGEGVVKLKRGKLHVRELVVEVQHDPRDEKFIWYIKELGHARALGQWEKYSRLLERMMHHNPNSTYDPKEQNRGRRGAIADPMSAAWLEHLIGG